MDDTLVLYKVKILIFEQIPDLEEHIARPQPGMCFRIFTRGIGQGYQHIYDASWYFVSYEFRKWMFPNNSGDVDRISSELGIFEVSCNWYWSK